MSQKKGGGAAMGFALLIAGVIWLHLPATSCHAYPGAKAADGSPACQGCHTSGQHGQSLKLKLLCHDRVKGVDGLSSAAVVAPFRKGSKTTCQLVLGGRPEEVDTVGWLWLLPAGVIVDAPGGVRNPGRGQPWDEYMDEKEGMIRDKWVTVIGQTFFFSPAIDAKSLEARLFIALGGEGKGAQALSGVSVPVVFFEEP